jgi:DNA-binding PadR family transcriptional regulator
MRAERDVQGLPMHSPVNWALLGLVIERPSYAYELAQRFDRSYEGVLALSSVSHVYTALSTLKSRSLIEEVPGTRVGRQPKTRYEATARGIEEYEEWLVSQVGEDRRRQRLFMVQLGAFSREPRAALEILDRYEQACLAEAGRGTLASPTEAEGVGSAGLLARLIGEESRLSVGAKLAWVGYARRELKALAEQREGAR